MVDAVPETERLFLAGAIDSLARDPQPDGVSRFVAPADSGYSGNLLFEVFPWRIVYQMPGLARVVIVAIQIHPNRVPMM